MELFYPVHSQQEGECQCDRKTLKTRREHVDLRFKSCHLDIYLWVFFLNLCFQIHSQSYSPCRNVSQLGSQQTTRRRRV